MWRMGRSPELWGALPSMESTWTGWLGASHVLDARHFPRGRTPHPRGDASGRLMNASITPRNLAQRLTRSRLGRATAAPSPP